MIMSIQPPPGEPEPTETADEYLDRTDGEEAIRAHIVENREAIRSHIDSIEEQRQRLLEKARQTPVKTPKNLSHYATNFPVACPECKKVMLGSSLRNHREITHGVPRGYTHYNKAFLEQFRVPDNTPLAGPGRNRQPGSRQRKSRAKTYDLSQTPVSGASAPKKTKALDADQLIDMVLESLFPKGIPVKTRRAVTRWAEATEQFITEAQL